MKKRYSCTTLRSFETLGAACRISWGGSTRKRFEMEETGAVVGLIEVNTGTDVVDEAQIFRRAMNGIAPLEADQSLVVSSTLDPKLEAKNEVKLRQELCHLNELVQNGIGSLVRDRPDCLSGGCYDHLSFSSLLGDDSGVFPSNFLDLHEHTVDEARAAFDQFLEEAVHFCRAEIFIIHGRGLSSPGEPILKKKVKEWLSSGKWRNSILSFCGARPEDGGEGATYVRLRLRESMND